MTPFRALLVLPVVALALAVAAWANPHDQLEAAKAGTSKYRDLDVATHAGYGLFKDAAGIACIAQPGEGAMGVHYVNGDFVGDTKLDPANPEAVVYEPRHDGKPRLVALEYIVFQAAWDAEHHKAPRLFGEEFMLTPSPNRFGIPAFYSLHAWLYKENPSGTFAMWNPRVNCPPEH